MQQAQEIAKQVTDLLRDFAQQLGVTVGELYRVLTVRAAYEGVVYSVWLAVTGAVLITVGIIMTYKGWDDCDGDGPSGSVVLGVLASIVGIIVLFQVPGYLIQAMSPEATAVQQLLRVLR